MTESVNPRVIERMLRMSKPLSPDLLWEYISFFYKLRIPRISMCPEHCAPFDYISQSFFEQVGDCLVWANRGGGKTENGAILTHLDAIFNRNCSIRILGGSLDQSLKMYKYLRQKWDKGFMDFLTKEPMRRETALINGSTIEVLTQSTRAVRGPHVQRMRCDEIDEFKPDVWEAVQFVTTSSDESKTRFEGLSTMHKPHGLFQDAIESKAYKVFQYCVWETIEKCVDFNCSRCELNPVCRGRAKKADGFVRIHDLIQIYRRASKESWESEMECKMPSFRGRVYNGFIEKPSQEGGNICEEFPTLPDSEEWEYYLTIDWGTENPLVCLLIGVNTKEDRAYVMREHAAARMLLSDHADRIKSWGPIGRYKKIWADPKGKRERIEFRNLGIHTSKARNKIVAGIEMLRRALKIRDDGKSGLLVSPSCKVTIREFGKYRYPSPDKDGKASEIPIDAHNHAMDALKNFFLSKARGGVNVS
jgi:hypothetical protein